MAEGNTSVCVLDYGSGNVASVRNMIESLAVDVVVSNDPAAIAAATHVVLPGVGAFAAAMRKVRERLPCEMLQHEVVVGGKPFLGICVGMQVLATRGLEFGEAAGLNWIGGTVRKLETADLTLPHIGWNDLTWTTDSPLSRTIESTPDFYFLHSYAFFPDDASIIEARACYGEEFPAVVRAGNICGVQFHPEKSQQAGMALLRNFLGAL
jgi:imidazole glycerol-phosphate synthase subunit HisH